MNRIGIKKFLTPLLAACIAVISTAGIPALAAEGFIQNIDQKEFINAIYEIQGREINEDDILDFWSDETGSGLIVDNGDGSFSCFTTITELDSRWLQMPNTAGTQSVWQVIKTISGIITKVYQAGKFVCSVIESTSGDNLCAQIKQQMLDSLVLNKRYKTTQVLHKDITCEPMHSAQCNMAPYVYWETTVVPA